MADKIDKKACFQKQLLDMSNLIEDLDDRIPDQYNYYNKTQADNKFVSKANLTDYSLNDIIVADSEIQSGEVDLRAVSSQDVKSEVSLDPTSVIIKVYSGEDSAQIGVSGTDIDLTGNVSVNNIPLNPETYEYSMTFFTGTAGSGPFQYFNVKFTTHDIVGIPTTYADVANIIWKYGTADNDASKRSMKAYSWSSEDEQYTYAVVWADNASPKKVYYALEGFVRIECNAIFSTITLGRRTI